MEMTGDHPFPALVSDNGIASLNKEARDYFASEGIEGIIACALLAKSSFSAFIGNFFIKVTSPALPIQLFSNKSKALQWLEQFKEK